VHLSGNSSTSTNPSSSLDNSWPAGINAELSKLKDVFYVIMALIASLKSHYILNDMEIMLHEHFRQVVLHLHFGTAQYCRCLKLHEELTVQELWFSRTRNVLDVPCYGLRH
jgi:hypothetical protein